MALSQARARLSPHANAVREQPRFSRNTARSELRASGSEGGWVSDGILVASGRVVFFILYTNLPLQTFTPERNCRVLFPLFCQREWDLAVISCKT